MKTAVVLFNLGGPDTPDAVRPFLFNLFSDPAILRLPRLFRFFLAKLISGRRAGKAKAIYAKMGGKSPIRENTQAQANALRQKLLTEGVDAEVFIVMRYWHPRSAEIARKVKDYAPEQIILLPLYPQFSTTTTASSFQDWEEACITAGLAVPTAGACCYPAQKDFISAQAGAVQNAHFEASAHGAPRVLFSAHGLPEKIIRRGDPYAWQVEKTVSEIVRILAIPGMDYVTCYQSRVGPMRWIGPATDAEIQRAGKDKKPLVVVPISFISEHSETLVELDIDGRRLAEESGVPFYLRVPALGVTEEYIACLAELCRQAGGKSGIISAEGRRLCPSLYAGCPCKE